MAGISDDQAVDYYYQDDLYVERPDDKLSCPICLCPVQREAHLTGCCGRHFCRSCIGRLSRECKPCPMCKESPLVIFPNKERQREIKQIRVRCPLSLAQYRGVLNSGRGRQEGTVSSNSDSSGKAATLSEEKDFKATEKCCIENQGGFSNTSDGSEVTILSENFDELKLSDNDLSTKCHKLNKFDENQATDGANKSEGSINRAKDSDAAATSACAWTGELGKVESHVSEVHGADALRQIKHDNDDDVHVRIAQPGTCPVHGHQQHHYNHSNIHILRHPQNVTYHGVRTQGGVTVRYHWPNPQPFNVSHSTTSPSSDVVNDPGPSVPPSGAIHAHGSSEPTSERGETVGLSREPQPLLSRGERGFSGATRNVSNQDFNLHVSSTSRSTTSDDQETIGGNGQSTGNVCRPLSNLEPDTHTGSTTGQQSHTSEPPPPQAQSQGSSSPRETERLVRVRVRAGQSPSSVADGQPSSPEQFMIFRSRVGGGLGQPIVQLVGPRRARGCPHHYHMRGMHGHHHHHHHHHRPPHFHHHHPPPPPHHGPPGPPHHPPHGHPPPGPGRGGHPHHHHHHHRHHGCHGHHHHPPPH